MYSGRTKAESRVVTLYPLGTSHPEDSLSKQPALLIAFHGDALVCSLWSALFPQVHFAVKVLDGGSLPMAPLVSSVIHWRLVSFASGISFRRS